MAYGLGCYISNFGMKPLLSLSPRRSRGGFGKNPSRRASSSTPRARRASRAGKRGEPFLCGVFPRSKWAETKTRSHAEPSAASGESGGSGPAISHPLIAWRRLASVIWRSVGRRERQRIASARLQASAVGSFSEPAKRRISATQTLQRATHARRWAGPKAATTSAAAPAAASDVWRRRLAMASGGGIRRAEGAWAERGFSV